MLRPSKCYRPRKSPNLVDPGGPILIRGTFVSWVNETESGFGTIVEKLRYEKGYSIKVGVRDMVESNDVREATPAEKALHQKPNK